MAQLLQNSTIGGKQIASEEFVSNKVKTDVPANAEFTDTIYTHPTSHPYSMITGAPTSLPANGGDSATVNGKTVEENVPAGAKFTDTVYSHPTSDGNLHVPATGTTNDGKVLKAGATAGSLAWGTDNDTITTINGKTGTITKADIVALGIPAQDTVYTHPAGTNPHGTTKSDVGLGNVDNIQQASKTEFDTHNSDSTRHITSSERTAWNAKGSSNLALGETSATAYRGDRGKTAYDHSQTAHAPANAQKNSDITKAEIEAKLTGVITTHSHTVTKANVGLGSVDNTSDADKPVSTAQAAAIALKIDASKFQVVTELPASPVTGVFYFVKE